MHTDCRLASPGRAAKRANSLGALVRTPGYFETLKRAGLRPRTRELYRWLSTLYLLPSFGKVHLSEIDPAMVRTWHARLLDSGVWQSVVAKAYRLLRAILMTAVEQDELIRRNPCRIVGAGTESPNERPTLSMEQVGALADLISVRQRMLVLVTTFASLRYGEVTALRRMDIDLARGTVSVRQAFTEVRGQGMVLGPPKSRAGPRTVALPGALVAQLADHLLHRDTLAATSGLECPLDACRNGTLMAWTGL